MICYVGVYKSEHGGHVTSVYTVTYILLSLSLSLSLSPALPPVLDLEWLLSDYREQQFQSSAKGDDDAQQFHAGGSEHSGQMIEGPPRKKANQKRSLKQLESELVKIER